MARFRKKPVEIEARQWDGGNGFHLVSWVTSWGANAELVLTGDPSYIEIHTLEGTMRADHGDWIIRGVQNEFYPCKPDILEASYELVED